MYMCGAHNGQISRPTGPAAMCFFVDTSLGWDLDIVIRCGSDISVIGLCLVNINPIWIQFGSG